MLERLRARPEYRRARRRLRRYRRRERLFRRAGTYVPYVGVETDSGVFIVSTRDKNIGRALFADGSRKEQQQLARALAVLDARGVTLRRGLLLDVGANIGTTSVAALVEQAFERVLAFEPEPRNYRLLRANLAVNDLDGRAATFRVALSDTGGTALLDVSPTNSGRYWILDGPDDRRRTASVPTVRLDDVLAEAGVSVDDVDLLWMDVEGHEAHVLAGAPTLLQRGVPTVLEFCPRHLDRAGAAERLLDLVRQSFTHVSDLRRAEEAPLPVSELPALRERYTDSFTDLLAFRDPSGVQ